MGQLQSSQLVEGTQLHVHDGLCSFITSKVVLVRSGVFEFIFEACDNSQWVFAVIFDTGDNSQWGAAVIFDAGQQQQQQQQQCRTEPSRIWVQQHPFF